LYMEALKGYRLYEMPKPIRTDPEEEIIKKLPPIIQPHAKQLLERIHPFVSWNDKGELVHKQLTVPHSNIVELLNDVLEKPKQDKEPVGWEEFAESLKTADIPHELIQKSKSWAYINTKPVSKPRPKPKSTTPKS